jgi:alpha-amylase/alpha-mannosidase (GH57 family)
MSDDSRLKVVLCWHMHQPQYRNLVSGQYVFPWTYLHAIKDYTDMAAHLEAAPQARAVVNFAPLLLEQIADYSTQLQGFLTNGIAIRDPLLAALAQPVLPAGVEERRLLLRACLRANDQRMIHRWAHFNMLASLARDVLANGHYISYLGDSYFADLLMWYHLAWLGETVRRQDERVRRLIAKEKNFTVHDRRELLAIIGELLREIVPRYRRLAEQGRVELSVTPYAHPIVPLLLDFQSARDAMPEVVLPVLSKYPQGSERARWHVREGMSAFERHFGFRPKGCWPSEGSVSAETLALLSGEGVQWAATGEQVLSHTLYKLGHAPHELKAAWLYSPYCMEGQATACFFRDDGLSDLIGFTYATWHADDAVADFVNHLENVATTCKDHPDRVVSVILDGENAWEYYPENGYYFLSALYKRLSQHPNIELTTFSDYLAQHAPKRLPALVAGSWVYGTFSTWIGDRDKNRGWDMLGEAKRAYDLAMPRLSPEEQARAREALAVCEGSDWFWWFGDYNPAEAVSGFEQLFRQHLTSLYQYLHMEPPDYLAQAFTHGGGAPAAGGTMRPGKES